MRKNMVDERINNGFMKVFGLIYFISLGVSLIGAFLKILIYKSFLLCLPEIVSIGITLIFMIIFMIIKGVLFCKVNDERIVILKDKIYTISLLVFFITYILQLIIFYYFNFNWYKSNFTDFLFVIPMAVSLIILTKRGLLIKKTNYTKKDRKIQLISLGFGSVVYGSILTGLTFLLEDKFNQFNVFDFLFSIVTKGILFLITFTLTYKLVLKFSMKNANKIIDDCEMEDNEK